MPVKKVEQRLKKAVELRVSLSERIGGGEAAVDKTFHLKIEIVWKNSPLTGSIKKAAALVQPQSPMKSAEFRAESL